MARPANTIPLRSSYNRDWSVLKQVSETRQERNRIDLVFKYIGTDHHGPRYELAIVDVKKLLPKTMLDANRTWMFFPKSPHVVGPIYAH